MTKIFIALPVKEKIMARTVACIINNISFLNEKGIKNDIYFGEGTLVPRVRTGLLDKFKKEESFTHIVFIDSDQTFDKDYIYKLVSYDKDVVGFPSKIRGGAAYNVYTKKDGDIIYKPSEEKQTTGLTKVDAIGFGMVCIKRDITFFFDKIEMTNSMSEDIYFCFKCKEHNIDIWADWDNIIGHLVTMELK